MQAPFISRCGVSLMTVWPAFLALLAATAYGQDVRVRPAAKAGTWYEANAGKLRKEIEGYFAAAPKHALPGPPVALIAPHAGYRYSGKCAGAVYAQLRGRDIRRVIVLAPSHHANFRGGSIAPVDCYETPLGRIPLDRKACDAILKSPLVGSLGPVHKNEHSLELHLPFLQVALGKFEVIPVVLGRLDEADFAALAHLLREHLDAHTLVVASSDFIHHGRMFNYEPFAKQAGHARTKAERNGILRNGIAALDQGAIERILRLDGPGFRKYVARWRATICGRAPIAVMLEMLTPDCRSKQLDYYLSGDREKDYAHSVSYASIAFTIGPGEVSAAGRKTLIEIARKTLQATLRDKKPPAFDIKDEELQVKRGVFVTYKNKNRLRGCIGHFTADEPLWKLVQQTAVGSARHDTRFRNDPITAAEEPKIDIQISVLSPMTRITDPLDFIVGVHGLYIRRGRRGGTYLPQVATEQGWDKRTFISHLCRHKIGLAADAWKQKGTDVFIYSAQVFGDK